MARVSNDLVVVEDTLYVSEHIEAAEKLHDPTHVRSYTAEEGRSLLEAAGLEIEQVESYEKRRLLEDGSRARNPRTGRSSGVARRPDRRRRAAIVEAPS
jgi:hypothetical protein